MVKRYSKRKANDALLGIGLILAAIVTVGKALKDAFLSDVTSGLAVIGVIGFGVFAIIFLNVSSRRKAKKSLYAKVESIVSENKNALSVRRVQLVKRDAYGGVDYDKWHKEVNHFINTQISNRLSRSETKQLSKNFTNVSNYIIEVARSGSESFNQEYVFDDKMTPDQFEVFCAVKLKEVGWDAMVTKRSRDQGVDIVATKDGKKLVMQCKLYRRSIGNKAVQEISAGRIHERADYAVVATNSKFTDQAEQLASTNKVLLMHFRSIPMIDKKLVALDD